MFEKELAEAIVRSDEDTVTKLISNEANMHGFHYYDKKSEGSWITLITLIVQPGSTHEVICRVFNEHNI